MKKETIEDWYKKYGPMVLRRCRGLLADEADAYDAMQEVFMQVLGKYEQIRDEYPSSFLFRTATNICLNKLRDAKKIIRSSESPSLLETIACDCDPTDRIAAESILDRIFRNEQATT